MPSVRSTLLFVLVATLAMPVLVAADDLYDTVNPESNLPGFFSRTEVPQSVNSLLKTAVPVVQLELSDFDRRPGAIAFDGKDYWVGKVGTTSGTTLLRFAEDGAKINVWANGIDYRSITFDPSDGTIYASTFNPGGAGANSGFGIQQRSGTWVKLYSASFQGSQAKPVVSPDGAFLYDLGESTDNVQQYARATGNMTATSITLDLQDPGFENEFTSIAFTGKQFLTLGNGTIYAYDMNGNLVGSSSIPGFGDTRDESISFNIANNLAFVYDATADEYVGYDIGLGGTVGCLSLNGLAVGNAGVIVKQGKKKFKVTTTGNGCFQVQNLKPGKPVKVLIKGPAVP